MFIKGEGNTWFDIDEVYAVQIEDISTRGQPEDYQVAVRVRGEKFIYSYAGSEEEALALVTGLMQNIEGEI
jgi:hypothetical protein